MMMTDLLILHKKAIKILIAFDIAKLIGYFLTASITPQPTLGPELPVG